jgi:hypothetical protein
MFRPPASQGMKQKFHLTRQRVDSTKVRTFVKIAAVAGKSEIFSLIAAAVLTGDNVFDVMRRRTVLLPDLAVLFTISCPLADKQPRFGIHR